MIKKTIYLIGRSTKMMSDVFCSDRVSERLKKSESSAISYCTSSCYFLILLLLGIVSNMKAATFDVNNTGDGAGSATVRTLRYCITQANASAGPHTITFNGLGTGTHTITLTSALPTIVRQVSIQGYTAASAVQGPLGPSSTRSIRIQINANDINDHIFTFAAGSDGSSVSGLAIYNTQRRCIYIPDNINGLHIWGNYFGLLANGTVSATPANTRLEDTAIFVGNETAARTVNNLIIATNGDGGNNGGTSDANEGNVIANTYFNTSTARTVNGIFFYGSGGDLTLTNSKVSGNYFGLLPDGVTVAAIGQNVPAAQGHPISFIKTVGTNVIIGTDANGVSDLLERNIVSGGTNYGIQIESGSGISIAGNYLGTDYTGTIARPNSTRDGGYPAINMQARGTNFAPNNIVVGFDDRIHTAVDAPFVRNVISGNAGRGVIAASLPGSSARTNNIVIAGNYIGVEANGNTSLPNGTFGPTITFSTGAGITLGSTINCRVGTDSDGVEDASERNVIAGNSFGAGVYINSNNFRSESNVVAGNNIGVGANGTTALGNGNAGVYLLASGNGTINNRVGSNDDGTRDDIEGNIIANNGFRSSATIKGGIMFASNNNIAANPSNNNRFSRNVYYNNAGLPIDLVNWNGTANDFGVTPNDGTTTANQPNLLLDYPVITGYSITSANTLSVSGYVSICSGNESTAGTTIAGDKTIHFYKVADDGDQNGGVTGGACTRVTSHGEGRQYLGSITGVVNAFTNQPLTFVSGATFSSGDKLVAIAIDATGNTSEFGATAIIADLAVSKSVNNSTAVVGSNVTFTITASNIGPDPASSVVVNDALPSGFTLVSATPSSGTSWSAPNWTIGNLAVGGTATLTIVATVKNGGYYANTATISGASTQMDPVLSNNSSTATVNVDSDADGIADIDDVDDDNDGILDTEECKTNTLASMASAFGAGTLLDIKPSDFGLALNAKNQNVSRDLSAKFGYPANSGAVIVSLTNASVHPTVDVWWTKVTEQPSRWVVTGTMSAYVLMAQDNANFYANDSKTIHIYDAATVVPVNIGPFNNQTAVAGQWSITETSTEKTLNNLDTNSTNPESALGWRYANLNFGPKAFGFSTTVASADPTYEVRMVLECDSDLDGIPDRLDLDSDADGCSDAVEGGATISTTQLVTAAGSVSGGSTAVNQNLCASNACVSTSGINIGLPQFSTLPTGYSNTTGQSVGDSQNALVNGCVCYESPTDLTAVVPVKHGITLLGRAGSDNGNWPMIRNSAYTALESKTKGFVVTRNASPETTIAVPVVGMMVFDIDENSGKGCLKIYIGSGAGEGWKCFTKQGCQEPANAPPATK